MKKAFAPIVPKGARVLILGTMPGEKSLALQQYYGNRGNQFWKILYAITNEDFSTDYNQRLLLLDKYKIAVWDVLAFCERLGSLDSAIKNETPNDFDAFYKKHPEIKYVFFSSKNAAAYYNRYVGRGENRFYDVLPSPSGANATMPFAAKLEVWKQKMMPLIA